MARGLILRGVVAAATLLTAAPALAQQGAPDVFSVSPSTQRAVDRPPAALEAVIVSNTTAQALDVQVFPVLLEQQIDGGFIFSESPRDLNAASKIVTPSVDRFSMEIDSTRSVGIRWNLLPRGRPAAFVGVVFSSRAQPAEGQTVKTVQRLLTLNFLRLPGPIRITGELTRLRASQGPERSLYFFPRLRNTGEFVGQPTRAKFRIRDADGDIVVNRSWSGSVVLPGFQREYPIEVKKVLPAGDYSAVATADFGSSKGLKIIERFRLAGPNQLPTGRVVIEQFRARGVIGADSRVTGLIRSVGTAPMTTAVRLDLYRLLANGQQPREPSRTRKLDFPDPLPPGKSADLELVYPGLPAGNYRVIGTYRAQEGSIERLVSDFSPIEERSAWQKFKDWLRRNWGLIVALGAALLFLAIVAYLVRRQRRLQRELEEMRAHQATHPVPASGRVSLNGADAGQLQRLPGVGVDAAAEIVADRERNGPFTRVEDLARVRGFSPQQVEALREHIAL